MTFDKMIQPSDSFGCFVIGSGTYVGMESALLEMSTLSDAELGHIVREKVLQTMALELDADELYTFRDYLLGCEHPHLIDALEATGQEVTARSMDRLLSNAVKRAAEINGRQTSAGTPIRQSGLEK